jgi:light-regulated signal transduction histidine kinase (bacteriophytochrome)
MFWSRSKKEEKLEVAPKKEQSTANTIHFKMISSHSLDDLLSQVNIYCSSLEGVLDVDIFLLSDSSDLTRFKQDVGKQKPSWVAIVKREVLLLPQKISFKNTPHKLVVSKITKNSLDTLIEEINKITSCREVLDVSIKSIPSSMVSKTNSKSKWFNKDKGGPEEDLDKWIAVIKRLEKF